MPLPGRLDRLHLFPAVPGRADLIAVSVGDGDSEATLRASEEGLDLDDVVGIDVLWAGSGQQPHSPTTCEQNPDPHGDRDPNLNDLFHQ